jgi:hypothetical protein
VTRQAETTFAEIENWMGKHKNWMDALTAKRGKQTKATSKRRGQPSRAQATQVLSPAGRFPAAGGTGPESAYACQPQV